MVKSEKAPFGYIYKATNIINGKVYIGKTVKTGRYVDMVDSYHIYGSYFNEFKGFLNTLKTKSFDQRTYSTSFAQPFFEEAKERIKSEK